MTISTTQSIPESHKLADDAINTVECLRLSFSRDDAGLWIEVKERIRALEAYASSLEPETPARL